MHFKISICPCLLIVATFSACQKTPRQETEPSPSPRQPVDYSQYFLFDAECQRTLSSSSEATGRFYLTSYKGDQEFDLEGIVAAKSLKTPVIAKTSYGETWLRHCHFYDEESKHCLDADFRSVPWTKVKGSGRALRVCPRKQNYPQDSFEYVALSAAYYLQQAHKFYIASTGKTVDPKLSLLVLPFFKTVYTTPEQIQQEEGYLFHNMIYFPNRMSLAILPEPQGFTGPNLWESAFILAHEFAHHVQFTSLRQMSDVPLGTIDLQKKRNSDKSIGAFLEGWADIYAFYAENENSSTIGTYRCFAYNRDVASPIFSDNTSKIISRTVLDIFYYSKELNPTCEQTDFTDSHTVGAAFAHNLHKIVSFVLHTGLHAYPYPYLKYRYLHEWFTATFALVAEDTSNADLMTKIIALVFKQAEKSIMTFDLDPEQKLELLDHTCRLFEDGFPSLSGCLEST